MDKIPLPPEAKYWSVTDRERWIKWLIWEKRITTAVIILIVPPTLAFLILSFIGFDIIF